MKDLLYLQAFSPKILREAKRILCKGFTAEDINDFLDGSEYAVINRSTKPSRRLPRGARRQILASTKFGRKRP